MVILWFITINVLHIGPFKFATLCFHALCWWRAPCKKAFDMLRMDYWTTLVSNHDCPLSIGQTSSLLPSRGQEEPVDLLDLTLLRLLSSPSYWITSFLIPLTGHQEVFLFNMFPFFLIFLVPFHLIPSHSHLSLYLLHSFKRFLAL